MLKRALLLSLSLWLMIAGGLAAHASPCHMQDEMKPVGASVPTDVSDAHQHCEMMAEVALSSPADPSSDSAPAKAPASDNICCCPAVLAALPGPTLPDVTGLSYALPASFPLDASAPSRTLIPEPPPPKA